MRYCLFVSLLGSFFPFSGVGAESPTDKSLAPALFQEVKPADSGLVFAHRLVEDHPLAYLYHSGFACGGVAIGDVNGDGRPDIFLASGPDKNALFLNKGGLHFEKAADAGVEVNDAWAAGVAMADVDGDGDLDIYVCHYNSPNHLYLNDGKGHFTECADAAGLAFVGPSMNAYFSDLDGDGDLDLFLVTNRLYAPTGYPKERAWQRSLFDGKARMKEEYAPFFRLIEPPWAKPGDEPFIQEYGHPDRIFLNDGPGPDGVPRFRDVTDGSGIEDADGHGLSALVFDANNDGRPDIYVANDYIDPDRLWINQGIDAGGRVHFKDETAERLPYTSWFSMGSDIADVNNDGRLDFMVGDMAATTHFKAKTSMGEMAGLRRWVLENGWPRQAMRNCLFINTGTNRWQEAAFLGGVARSDWTWSIKFADYDLDGRIDIFISNGIARAFSDSDLNVTNEMRTGRTEWDIYKHLPEMRERNLAFRNAGYLQFENRSAAWGLDKEGMSYGAAAGDLDGDGDVDLVVCNLTENVSLYRNFAADRRTGHWLSVRLEPAKKHTALGAIVTIKSKSGLQTRLYNPMTGFLSSNEPVLHWGLGADAVVDEVRVRWPAGGETVVRKQPADRLLVVTETANLKPAPLPKPATPLFVEKSAALGLAWKHQERQFNDYKREFLLPAKLSQLGPGVAIGDVNGDKVDDIFVCGAAGQPDKLFLAGKDGKFTACADGAWVAHDGAEHVAALFFDADRDGDLDLYVVTGSNEWAPDDAIYADHLYLNQTVPGGPVTFTEAAAGALPDLRASGSCAVAADFDHDGDLDLFVGARSVPGAYPVTPVSALLRNDSTKAGECRFTDVTGTVAPPLRTVGLVTSAVWSDVDSDGWVDLLVTCEWGAVRLFHNNHGTLSDMTESAGLAPFIGWWNSIVPGDFDGDGDIDFVALNAGLNTKYGHPTSEKPLLLYRGDMDGDGRFDLVEAKPSPDGELPVRGRSCSSQAMPFLKEKFPTYKAFAASVLDQIYEPQTLAGSLKVSANTLESALLVNESKPGLPKFTFRPLPPEAQLSPGYGAAAADFNGDGWTDLVFSQNLYTREPETGLWRGSVGCVLLGGKNGLVPLSPDASGFIVAGDGKGLAIVDHNGAPAVIALQNDDQLLAFTADGAPQGRSVAVRLRGPAGNPTAIGARVTLLENSRPVCAREVTAGSGYQSQSTATVFVTIPPALKEPRLRVRWPDGRENVAAIPSGTVLDLVPPDGVISGK